MLKLGHDNIYTIELRGFANEAKQYDFSRVFNTKDVFAKSDLVVGNLETALDAGKNGIMHKARTALGDLSEMDGLILTCIYAGMPPSSIGFVTGLKPGTVRTRKSRLLDRIEALPASGEKELLLREWV